MKIVSGLKNGGKEKKYMLKWKKKKKNSLVKCEDQSIRCISCTIVFSTRLFLFITPSIFA